MSFLDNIKSVSITEYARMCGYTVVKKGNRYASLKEHDSVIIDCYKNCYWRNSVFQVGAQNRRGASGSVIDFAMEFNGFNDAKKAMRDIAIKFDVTEERRACTEHLRQNENETRPKIEGLELPEKADNYKYVYAYLIKERKIDLRVVNFFVKQGMLYQDIKNNCVFHTKNFGCIRSTFGKKFVRDLNGCNYDECFFFRGSPNARKLIVAEGVIDIMSIMTEFLKNKIDVNEYCYLALTGTNKLSSLYFHIERNELINHIMLSFDNDAAGVAAQEEALVGLSNMGFKGEVEVFTAPFGKDWNEYLQLNAKNNN